MIKLILNLIILHVLSLTMNKYNIEEYLSSIEDIIEDARNGKMYILVDDPDREMRAI